MENGLPFLLSRLMEIGAVKIDTSPGGGFTLKIHETQPNAPKSPFYLNLRTPENPKQGPLTQDDVSLIGSVLCKYARSNGLSFDGIVGLPRAGEPIAEAFRRAAMVDGAPNLPMLRLSKVEAEGKRRIDAVVGNTGLPRNSLILLIDDLVTGGDTKEEAIDAVRRAGLAVNDILVLVDRQQGAIQHLSKRSVNLHAVITISAMLRFYLGENIISVEDHGIIMRYLKLTPAP